MPEIAAYLKHETHYKDVLADVEEALIHRGQLENLLRREVLERYSRLLRFEHSSGDEFYGYMVMKNEIEQILLCIRLLNSGSSEKYISWMPGYLIKICSFDLIKLAKISSFDELLQILSDTPYGAIIERFKPQNGEIVDVSACEAALMTYYYQKLLSAVKKHFKGDTQSQLVKMINSEIDLYNIMVIYRLKKYFNSSEQYIHARLIPIKTALSGLIFKTCLTEPEPERFLQWLKNRRVSRHFDSQSIENLEQLTAKISIYRARKNMRFSVEAPVVLFSFMILMNAEVENIINVIEGKRYKVSDSVIEKLLLS
ncbi:MAG TPA: hypothetical protein DCP97_03625 [Ruminococcaceae bacterium]|nr:hypothetical protein [Oscillospiraceae bacterium]